MLAINKKSKFSLLTGCATFVISGILSAPMAYAQSFGNSVIDAAEMGNVSQVYSLVGMGQDVNAVGRFGVTALHRAAYNDSIDVGQALIESGASLNPKDAGGATPLHIAARRGNVDFIQLLVKNGVDIDARDNEGFTSLQRAIASDNDTAAVNLVAFGANANIANNAGETAISTATQRNDQIVLRAINARTAAKAPAGKSDVVAAPVAQVAVAEVGDLPGAEPSYKPVIIKARQDTAPANQFDKDLELKKEFAEVPVLAAPVEAPAPVLIPMPDVAPSSNLPKSLQFARNSGHSNAVVAAPVIQPVAEPVFIKPLPASNEKVVKTKAIDVAEEPIASLTPVESIPVETAQEAAWNTPVDSQTSEITAPGYNNVINLDKTAEGIRANGILVSGSPVVAAPAPAPVEIVAHEPVIAVIEHAKPAVPASIKEEKANSKLPKSMQKNTNFNADSTPLSNEVSSQIITPVGALPSVPVEGIEKQPLVKEEVVTVTNHENQIVKQETTVTEFPAAPIAPAVPVTADPIEKRASALINEPLNFNKYDTPSSDSTGGLNYQDTLKTLEQRRDTNAVKPLSETAPVSSVAAGVAGVAAGAAAVKAAEDNWGGLSEHDIEQMNKELETKEKAAKKAQKKTNEKAKAAEAKVSKVKEDVSAASIEVSEPDVDSTKKKIEETLNKNFDDVKTAAKDEVAEVKKESVKLPDEKQSDVGTAKLVSTGKQKTAEVAHVAEEELKAPEMPSELTPPALPGFETKVEAPKQAAIEEKTIEAVAPAEKMNEMPALPDLAAPAAKDSAAVAVDDKDFESKLKGIEAKKDAAAPKAEEKFALNESISSTELEVQESKNKAKSVFDDIKKMSDASKADIYAVVGSFASSDAANKHYNNIAGKTGLVFPYKVVKSSGDNKTYLQLGPVEDVRITEDICASFAVESKTCRVPSISDEDKKFLKTLKVQGEKKVYSLIGEFKTEKDAKEFYSKVATEKALTFKYSVIKTSKGGVFGLQVGPLVNGGESKDVCDAFKADDTTCVVSVK